MTQKQKSFRRWVEGAVVYQIYPRSFYDSNGDGIGDIPGVTKKLDYLEDLGVNAVWLSPFYPSPNADFGYDVADYCDVDPIFGTLADFDKMVTGAHKRGIKVMVDLVPNHSSDEHEWFRQSRQSREDKYSDWYIWHDPKGYDEKNKPIPPNNWIEVLTGGSAWEWEPARQQFYLHSFDVRQPDLNWTNPKVREAMKDVMRFWLDRDVDGFRVDAVHFMAKDPTFKNEPENPHYDGHGMRYARLQHPYNHGWPPMYVYLAEMAAVLKEPKYQNSDRFMVTEAYPDNFHNPIPEYLTFYEGMDPAVAAPFNFEGLQLPWSAPAWHKFLQNFHSALDAFNPLCIASYAFGNHDQHRLVSRRGPEAARAAAVLLLTLPGMAFIYNGDEIGMKNGHIPKQFIQDPGAKGGSGRDPERTPVQWSAAKNAGFTTAKTPWLPIADNYETVNIQTESKDPDSFLNLYKELIKLRNKSNALKYGGIRIFNTGNPQVLGFIRTRHHEQYTVLINFHDGRRTVNLKDEPGKFVVSSDPETEINKAKGTKFHLRPHEAVIFVSKT
jgi:alpha-glucosidase